LFDSHPLAKYLAIDSLRFYSLKDIYKRKREQLKEREEKERKQLNKKKLRTY